VAPPAWRNDWPSFSVERSRLKTLVSTGRYGPTERRGREGGREGEKSKAKRPNNHQPRFSLPLLNQLLGPDVADEDYVAWQCDQDAYAYSGTFLSSLPPSVLSKRHAATLGRAQLQLHCSPSLPPSLPPSTLPQAKNAPPNPSSSPTRTGKPPAWKTSCGGSPPAVPSRI